MTDLFHIPDLSQGCRKLSQNQQKWPSSLQWNSSSWPLLINICTIVARILTLSSYLCDSMIQFARAGSRKFYNNKYILFKILQTPSDCQIFQNGKVAKLVLPFPVSINLRLKENYKRKYIF